MEEIFELYDIQDSLEAPDKDSDAEDGEDDK